jgi:CRP-like cAMP-binding protein
VRRSQGTLDVTTPHAASPLGGRRRPSYRLLEAFMIERNDASLGGSPRTGNGGASTTTDRPWFVTDTGFDAYAEMVFMRVCPEHPYERGEAIFREGDAAEHLHVVARGRIKLVPYTPEGRERILAIVGPDELIAEARRFGHADETDPEGLQLDTPLRHEGLAGLVGATRVSVSTAVAELRREGILEGTRGRYRMHAPALEGLELPA